MHRPFDLIYHDSKVVKDYYRFKCDIEKQFIIENHVILTHCFNVKNKKIILYFPGGSFIDPPTILHGMFAKTLSKTLNYQVIMFQYPLFPELNPLETANLIYKIIIKMNISDYIILGDSAGANLALYILNLHNQYNNYLSKVILISPWFDGKMSNKDISFIKDNDFILNKDNCYLLSLHVYSKYQNDKMYLAPKNKDFKYASNILLINGEKEIFTPDAKLWVKNQKILNIKHLVYKNMCHCFTLLPIKEANDALKEIKKFIFLTK
jgi:acetyl esterase/lipase